MNKFGKALVLCEANKAICWTVHNLNIKSMKLESVTQDINRVRKGQTGWFHVTLATLHNCRSTAEFSIDD